MICVSERMCVDVVRAFDRDMWMVIAKSGFISGDFRSSLEDYGRASNSVRASGAEEGVEEKHET